MNDDTLKISDLIRILKLLREHTDDETLYEEDGHLVIALSKDATLGQESRDALGEYDLFVELDEIGRSYVAINLGGE